MCLWHSKTSFPPPLRHLNGNRNSCECRFRANKENGVYIIDLLQWSIIPHSNRLSSCLLCLNDIIVFCPFFFK